MPGPKGTPFSPPGGYGPGNTVTVELANESYIRGRFKQYQAGMKTQVEKMQEEVANRLRDAAKDFVAVDTGKTKDSIRTERRGDLVVVVADRHGDRPEVPIYLEIGTFKMAARPFMKPAVDIVMTSAGLLSVSKEVGHLLGPMRGLGFGR